MGGISRRGPRAAEVAGVPSAPTQCVKPTHPTPGRSGYEARARFYPPCPASKRGAAPVELSPARCSAYVPTTQARHALSRGWVMASSIDTMLRSPRPL